MRIQLDSKLDLEGKHRRHSVPHRYTILNDVHARLNASRPVLHRRPNSVNEMTAVLEQAHRRGLSVAIAGGRHAMGGQQFRDGGCVLDLRGLNRILDFDREQGLITVEAGATWPELMRGYLARQAGDDASARWGIRQKQTGADNLTVGGALAANIHGRGLTCPPFSADVVSFHIVTASGELLICSREREPELFSLVIGGYGLLGVVVAVTMRLVPRQKVERVVGLLSLPELLTGFETRIAEGYTFGDFQFATDPRMPGFMSDGVFSCYRPVDNATPIAANQIRLSQADWRRLLYFGHVNKRKAFMEFADFYMRSSGQLYWNDTHQLNIYLDDYHRALDRHMGVCVPGTEMITELYVPRHRLTAFMAAVREDFRLHDVNFIYGTIRLIQRDRDAFLKWAKDDYACVIFNLHVDHDPPGIERAGKDFRRLIDRAIEQGGSYFLTYHRFARRDQVLRCYPEFPEFLRRKRHWDPDGRFASDWSRHYEELLAGEVS
ncbi:MAG: FAD-binding oxidoreductase [Steroidobacteraceae bacterium]